MTECCGEVRSTPFCPMCGKSLIEHQPLFSLLAYCRTQGKKQESRTGSAQERGKDRDARDAAKHAERWKVWGDALAELLAREVPSS
jgi:hypothetical protein